ncbi:hypothetical protein [Streptomyces cinereoruber]|uniref:hypothetical protein n=1 Tax=Streptomyces cinereoruber TaxID=67260 RepID=UPI00364262C6
MTPADELRAAAKVLRVPDDTVTIPAAAANALADLLHTEANRLGAAAHPHWKDTAAYRALAVARALNGDR